MMDEIYYFGPIVCGINSTILNYYTNLTGIIRANNESSGSARIDHHVLVYGWGIDENKTKYWKVKNSWGSAWGINGHFKI